MKNYLLGVLSVLLISGLGNYLTLTADMDSKADHIGWKMMHFVQLDYLMMPLTGRCDDLVRPQGYAGAGKTNAEYFQCDKIQKLINISSN